MQLCSVPAPGTSWKHTAQPAWHCLLPCSLEQEPGSLGGLWEKELHKHLWPGVRAEAEGRPCYGISEPKLSVRDEMSLPGHVLYLSPGVWSRRGLEQLFAVLVLDATVLRQGLRVLWSHRMWHLSPLLFYLP